LDRNGGARRAVAVRKVSRHQLAKLRDKRLEALEEEFARTKDQKIRDDLAKALEEEEKNLDYSWAPR